MPPAEPAFPPDFRRLWRATVVSQFGSAVGSGALPLIAVLVLDASALRVSFLAVFAGLAGAALALPMGTLIEFRRKRPVMITADVLRFAALGSVPVAFALGGLTYAHLCVAAVAQTAGVIVFNAAAGAHLKALVPAASLARANARLETGRWILVSVGPALGGVLLSVLGFMATVIVDAVGFLLSALGVRRLRSPEPPPPPRTGGAHWTRELTVGWRYLLGHPVLRPLFWNAMLFGGALMAASPLQTVLMLRDLGFTPWQYGLALGLPCIGGVLGSLAAPALTARFGARPLLLIFGTLRTVWLGVIAVVPEGTPGLLILMTAETALLLSAGVFNPVFTTTRMTATDDHYMSRAGTAWSVASRTVQPLFIAAGGVLAAVTSTRTAIAVAAVVLVASTALLPWRRPAPTGGGEPIRDIPPAPAAAETATPGATAPGSAPEPVPDRMAN